MTDKIFTLIQNLEKDLLALKTELAKTTSQHIKANQKMESPAETQARLSKTRTYVDFTQEN